MGVRGVCAPGGKEGKTVCDGVDKAEGGADYEVWLGFGGTGVGCERSRGEDVVGIDEEEERATGPVECSIAGYGNASVFGKDDGKEAGVSTEDVAEDGEGVGVGTVQNIEKFDILKGLGVEGVGVFAQERFRDAVDGDDDGKERRESVHGRRQKLH